MDQWVLPTPSYKATYVIRPWIQKNVLVFSDNETRFRAHFHLANARVRWSEILGPGTFSTVSNFFWTSQNYVYGKKRKHSGVLAKLKHCFRRENIEGKMSYLTKIYTLVAQWWYCWIIRFNITHGVPVRLFTDLKRINIKLCQGSLRNHGYIAANIIVSLSFIACVFCLSILKCRKFN